MWVGLQCVIVAFPCHTYLHFGINLPSTNIERSSCLKPLGLTPWYMIMYHHLVDPFIFNQIVALGLNMTHLVFSVPIDIYRYQS